MTKPQSAEVRHETAQSRRFASRYVVLDELGRGGMAAVYRVRDDSNGSVVALKLLAPELVGKREAEALFEREYHTLVGLKHPRIIEVYEYGVCEAGPYYTMELLDGKDLRQLAPLPFRQACKHLRDVASSLALLHARKLLHRDVSPRNVRLTNAGRAKLLDFGALATFGCGTDVIGTAPFVAPEALLGAPLDQRADLFALGALAYWLLTGRHGFPARRIEDLPALWRTAPPLPSALAPEVPKELDALVMSLLRFDALGRPTSAAAVIDALSAIAELEAEETHQEAQSYVASGALVGRARDMAQLRDRLAQAKAGAGSAVLIEADAGVGKTRLLDEFLLEAQLQGAAVLRAKVAGRSENLAVAKAVALALLRALPAQAKDAAEPLAPVLGNLSSELHEKLGSPSLLQMPSAGSEARALFQDALLRWISEIARQHSVVIGVDDVHAADDESLALLAALTVEVRTQKLLIVATYDRNRKADEGSTLAVLRRGMARLRIGNLRPSDVDELVRDMFGDAAHASRFAKLLYERSLGIPLECMELLRYAVSRGVIKYVDGTWMLPPDVSAESLPEQIKDVLSARLSDLSENASRLARGLSIQDGELSLERCLWLARGLGEAQLFGALDELVASEVLVGTQASYRFNHETQRQALQNSLSEDERRALHRTFAEALSKNPSRDALNRLEIGWHLLRAGDESRGADVLASVGLDRELPREHAPAAVRGLQAALDVYEQEGRSEYELAAVLLPLMSLGYYVDYRLLRKYGERAIDLGLRITGLRRAQKLRRYLGARLALIVCLVLAGIRLRRARKRARAESLNYSLRDAIALTCTAGPAVAGTAAICMDVETLARVSAMLEPLSYFGKQHVGSVLYGFCRDLVDGMRGRGECVKGLSERVALLEEPGRIKGLAEASRIWFSGGNMLYLGLMQAFQLGSNALETADRIEALGSKLQAVTANQIRLLYHAHRGEMHLAQQYRERFELQAVQGGTTWQAEIWAPVAMNNAYYATGDALNLRRTSEQLAHQARALPPLALSAEMGRAFYSLVRGDAKSARELLEKLCSQIQPRQRGGWVNVRAALATSLIMLGEYDSAKRLCNETIAEFSEADAVFPVTNLEIKRQLALAEAGLGNHVEAARLLDLLLDHYERGENPLCVGRLHEARAYVALLAHDAEVFERHLAAMERSYRGAGNPALIAHWERLYERGMETGLCKSRLEASASHPIPDHSDVDGSSAVRALFSKDDVRAHRFEELLERMLSAAGSRSGYLFVSYAGRVELVSSRAHSDPPEWLRQRVELLIAYRGSAAKAGSAGAPEPSPRDDDDDEDDITKTTQNQPFTVALDEKFCRILSLGSERGGPLRLAGAVVLELDPDVPLAITPENLRSFSNALCAVIEATPFPESVGQFGTKARTQDVRA